MADIAMCMNEACKLWESCYRAQATPNPYAQSYAGFKPEENGECNHYWKFNGKSEYKRLETQNGD